MSEHEALQALSKGINAWTQFRDEWQGEGRIDCSGGVVADAKLDGYDLSDVSFVDTRFERTTFNGANLRNTELRCAYFGECDLSGASMYGAELTSARIIKTRMRATSLLEACLVSTFFDRVDLTAASMSRAMLGRTVFLESTLGAIRAYKPLHLGRSRIDIATLSTVPEYAHEGLLSGFGIPSEVSGVLRSGVRVPRYYSSCALWKQGSRSGDLAPLERLLAEANIDLSIVDSEALRIDDTATRLLSAAFGTTCERRANLSGAQAMLLESENVVIAVTAATVESPWLNLILTDLLKDVRDRERRPPFLLLVGERAIGPKLVATIAQNADTLSAVLEGCPSITLDSCGPDAPASLIAASEAIQSYCER